MPLEVRPLSAALGAEIQGIDLARGLDEASVAAIRAAWLAHGVLLFRAQSLADDDLIRFSRHFGDLESAPASENRDKAGGRDLPVWVISNVVVDGKPIGDLGAGEAEWHTDMSYDAEPPMASLLYALKVPAAGGDTYFANMCAAFEQLPQPLRARIEGRGAKHDSSYTSVGALRRGATAPADALSAPGAVHPIVRTHPETGRKALYLGRRRNGYIEGLELADSEALLDTLWAGSTKPEFVWAHQWRAGDLVLWDNRCVIHRRDPFDPAAQRIMHRTQVKGDRPV